MSMERLSVQTKTTPALFVSAKNKMRFRTGKASELSGPICWMTAAI